MSNHKFLFTFLLLLSFVSLAGCSEDDRQALGALSDLTKAADAIEEVAPSTYSDNCLKPLSGFMDDITDSLLVTDDGYQANMSSKHQSEAVILLNRCIEEMQLEIDLTEKEFPKLNELAECKKNLDSMVAIKSQLQMDIREFQSLPNSTSEDSNAVAEGFGKVYSVILIKTGALAMSRAFVCTLEKVAPDRFKKES